MLSDGKDLTPDVIRRKSARSTRLGSLPTAGGGIARAAYAAAKKARLDVRTLLKNSDLTLLQAEKPQIRIPVKSQIKFLHEVASALPDDLLGVHLAQAVDLRELGLLYYVVASSESLGDALIRVARYSAIQNEGYCVPAASADDLDRI